MRTQHAKPAQRGDDVCEVLLGVVQLLDVAADLLHHGLALVRLGLNLQYVAVQLLRSPNARGWPSLAAPILPF